jgi:hypothetical protein
VAILSFSLIRSVVLQSRLLDEDVLGGGELLLYRLVFPFLYHYVPANRCKQRGFGEEKFGIL